MSGKMKQSIIHCALWAIVAAVLIIVFTSKGTIEAWGDNRTKTILLAALFFFGFTGDAVLRFVFRKSKVTTDERDEFIQGQSLKVGYVVTVLYIFILSISLYTKYEVDGSVPIAWIWFIAYTLIVVVNLSTSAASIIQYRKSE